MLQRIFYLAGAGICAAALLGASQCQSNNNNGIGPDGPNFVTTLAVEDANGNAGSSFTSSQQIQFVLSVRNRSNRAQTMGLTGCPPTNFVVLDAGTATQVWSQNAGQATCALAQNLTWQPGETKTFTVTWNQIDNSGQLVPAGSYEAVGGLVCTDNNTAASSEIERCMLAHNPGPDDILPSAFISTLVPFTIQ